MKKTLKETIEYVLSNELDKFYNKNREMILEDMMIKIPARFPAGDEWDEDDVIDLVDDFIKQYLEKEFIDYLFSQENNK